MICLSSAGNLVWSEVENEFRLNIYWIAKQTNELVHCNFCLLLQPNRNIFYAVKRKLLKSLHYNWTNLMKDLCVNSLKLIKIKFSTTEQIWIINYKHLTYLHINTDPQTGVVTKRISNRNMRSRYRWSMCPANHISSRSLLRSSSTREPSDPPHRVVILFIFEHSFFSK